MVDDGVVSERADAGRLEALYATHARRVLAYARRRVPPEDAEEVVAETFLTAWRRIDAVPEDALPWLLAVARRVVSNKRRAANRRAALVSRLRRAVHRQPLDSTAVGSDGLREKVLASMSALSERDREALMLSYWDDLDPVAAARVAGCSPRAFSTRLYRARRHLAARLAGIGVAPAVENGGAHLYREEANEP